jgi:hypothetical protein
MQAQQGLPLDAHDTWWVALAEVHWEQVPDYILNQEQRRTDTKVPQSPSLPLKTKVVTLKGP